MSTTQIRFCQNVLCAPFFKISKTVRLLRMSHPASDQGGNLEYNNNNQLIITVQKFIKRSENLSASQQINLQTKPHRQKIKWRSLLLPHRPLKQKDIDAGADLQQERPRGRRRRATMVFVVDRPFEDSKSHRIITRTSP